jgi:hypothetical protein
MSASGQRQPDGEADDVDDLARLHLLAFACDAEDLERQRLGDLDDREIPLRLEAPHGADHPALVAELDPYGSIARDHVAVGHQRAWLDEERRSRAAAREDLEDAEGVDVEARVVVAHVLAVFARARLEGD